MTTPNKARIQLWVDALRSGEYRQARGALRRLVPGEETDSDLYGYCCLGVACEIARKTESSISINYGQWTALPGEVAKWYGLDAADPWIGEAPCCDDHQGDMKKVSASEANDNLKWSFDRIAFEVEKKYLQEAGDGE